MTNEYKTKKTMNPMVLMQGEEYIEQIFKAAVIYYKFEKNLKKINESKEGNKDEKIYMISKEFLDNFKNKIDYDKIKDIFADEENEEKKDKFKEQLMKYNLEDLELIILAEFNLYGGDFEQIEEDCKKGFEFVNYEFLDQLDYEFDANMKESNIEYYKDNNKIIIVFSDKSKLLISEQGEEKKYYAIPSPVDETKGALIKKNKTFSMKKRKTEKK